MENRRTRKTISREQKENIIGVYQSGGNVSAYCRDSQIKPGTGRSICRRFRVDNGLVVEKRGGCKPSKLTQDVEKYILGLVEDPDTADLTIEEMATRVEANLQVSLARSTISRFLSKSLITYKKSYPDPAKGNTARNMELRCQYIQKMMMLTGSRTTLVIWIDETSVQLGLHRSRAWAHVGDRAYSSTTFGTNKGRTVCAAMTMEGMENIVIHKGNFSGIPFQHFFQETVDILVERYPNKSKFVFVMDNVPFHVSKATKEFTGDFDIPGKTIEVMYLPVYSPFLNPIELIFGIFKNNMRTDLTVNRVQYTQHREDNKRTKGFAEAMLNEIIERSINAIPDAIYHSCYTHITEFYTDCMQRKPITDQANTTRS